ncbi:isopeptide-forming domain-containing fimbrial protein [Thiolapillus sp.]
MLLILPGIAMAATPVTDLSNLPAQSFSGEQFCFDAPLTNTGTPGFGPYLRLKLPPALSFDSANFLGAGVSTQVVGTFPPDQTDPVDGETVTGPAGYTLITLQPPIGSLVAGAPSMDITICSTIDQNATIGVPLDVYLTPVLQFGDTATGDNGPVTGTEVIAPVTPTLVVYSKRNDAPETERPPGASWPYTYTLNADIANGATLQNLLFSDALPASLQYVAGSINVTGGMGCVPTVSLPDITVNCAQATGTTADNDVMVTYQAYVTDILDETSCVASDVINSASFAPYGPQNASTVVSAEHVTMQKSVSPARVSPGDTLTYTVSIQVSDFATVNALLFSDLLPDGLENFQHVSLTHNGTAVPVVPPTVTDNGDGTTSILYDLGAAISGPTIAPGSSLVLTYTADVSHFYNNNDTVKARDPLVNSGNILYELTAGASGCNNGSSATTVVHEPSISKEILNPQPLYQPGDTVTFRLSMVIPSGDSDGIVFEDFFPLPVFDVDTLDITNFGPGHDIRYAPTDTANLTASVSIDSAANSLRFDWAGLNSNNPPHTIAVDVDMTVQSDPFADGLHLTNLFQGTTENTAGSPLADLDIIDFDVSAPSLVLTKGVLASSHGNIAPPPATLPVDGNLSGADAGDQVTYQFTVENTGGAPAYDVSITDDMGIPNGLLANCNLVSVTDGAGNNLASTPSAGSAFAGSVQLTSALAANDGSIGAPYGADTALVQVQCTLAAAVEPGRVITNTGSASWSSQPGATPFPAITDTATTTVAEPTLSKTTATTSATIGDVFSYTLTLTVPEGTSNSVTLHDELDAGLAFVDMGTNASINASAGLSTSIGGFNTVLTNASVTNSGRVLDLDFGVITNTDTDDNIPETIVITYDVVVINSTDSSRGDAKNNRARLRYLRDGGTHDQTAQAPDVTVQEPEVQISKTVVSSGPFDAGDTVTYEWHVSNPAGANVSDAYDVLLTDTLHADTNYVANSLAVSSGCPSGVVLDDSAAPVLTASWTQLAAGEDCRIRYDVVLDTAVQAGSSLDNTAGVDWTGLPGVQAGPFSSYNANSCERTSPTDANACGSGNDYHASSTANLAIAGAVMGKSLLSTSEPSTGSAEHNAGIEDLTIGETATYRLVVTVPEGTSQQIVVTDSLPASAAGVMEVVSVDSVTVGGNLATANSPGGTISDANLGDGINDTVIWDFGQVVNQATDGVTDDDDRIIIVLTARLVDAPSNADGDRLTNTALVQFGPGLTATATVDIDVVEPRIQLDKSGDITSGDAGDPVTFTIDIQHQAASTTEAFDMVMTDVLDNSQFDFVAGSLSAVSLGSCSVVPALDQSDPFGAGLSASFDNLPVGDVCRIQFQATLRTDVNPGQVLTNVANVTWDTLPADGDPHERSYSVSDNHQITVTEAGVLKNVTATSEASTGTAINGPEPDLTIGELVTYQFVATLPEGITRNAVMTDQLPTAGVVLELVSSRIVSIGSQLTIGSGGTVGDAGDGCLPNCDSNGDSYRDQAQWNLGDITNAPGGAGGVDDEIVFEVVALVVDDPANQGRTDDDLVNTATLSHAGNPGGVSGTAMVDLVEPLLDISKRAVGTNPLLVDAGDTVTFEITVAHQAASSADAFNVHVSDTLANDGSFALMDWINDATVGGTCGASVDSSSAGNMPPVVNFDVPTLALANGSCTITYQVNVDLLAMPGETLTNVADWRYDSTPTYVAGQTRRNTGSASAQVTVLAPTLVKVVSSTSLADTGQAYHDGLLQDLAIGELVTYDITVKFVEGTTSNAVLTDFMPAGAPAQGVIEVVGNPIITLGGNVSTTQAVITNPDPNTLSIDFGTVTNTPDNTDDVNDLITIRVTGRVVDVPDNVDGDQLVNTATLTYGAGSTLTDTAAVDVVEPDMAITKSMSLNNGVVTMTVNITNNGTAPAYDIQIEDVLDSANWDTATITAVSVPAGYVLTTAAGPGATETTVLMASDAGAAPPVNSVDPAETVSFVFSVPLASTAPLNIPNTATNTVTTTLPGTDPDERGMPDVNGTASLLRPQLSMDKAASRSVDADGSGSTTPGDTIHYVITITNSGLATASNLLIDDAPDGNGSFQAGSVVAPGGTVVVGNTAGDTAIQVRFPSLAVQGQVTIEYDVVIPDPLNAGVVELVNQALANSDQTTQFPSNNPNTPDPLDPTVVPIENADLSITKVDSADPVSAGDTFTYTIEVQNAGPSLAPDVVVTDTLPAGLTLVSTSGCAEDPNGVVSCSLGDVPVNGTASYTISVQADQGAPGSVTNTASVTSAVPDPDPGNNTANETTAINQRADLSIVKVDNVDPVVAGDLLTYTMSVTNNGPSNAVGVVVSDSLPGAVTAVSTNGCVNDPMAVPDCTLGDLQPGMSVSYQLVVRVNAGTTAALMNSAQVTSNTPDPDSSNNTATEPTAVNASADLRISKVDNADPVNAGDQVIYTIVVTNDGPSDAVGVTVADTLPTGMTLISSNGCSNDPSGVPNCSLGNLAAGASTSYTVTARVASGISGTLTNTAVVSATTPDPDTTNNTATEPTTVGAAADLRITKTDDIDPVGAGATVTYTLQVFNDGPSDAVGVVVTDTLPAGMTFVASSGCDNDPSGVPGCNLGNMAAGTSKSYTVQATVDQGTTGTLTNTASVSSSTPDPNTGNNTATEPTTVGLAADLRITKTDNVDPVNAGDQVVYSIQVTNDGPSNAVAVTVADTLPAGMTLVSTTGCSNDPNAVPDCSLGDLAVGASVSYTVTVQVDAGANGTLTNTAVVSSSTPDPDMGNNTATEPTTVGAAADLRIIKVDDVDPVNAGDQVVYSIRVTNDGPSNAVAVTVADTLPAGMTLVSTSGCNNDPNGAPDCSLGDLAVGASVSYTVTVQVDAGANGTLTNTAVVSSNTPDPDTGNNTATEPTTVGAAADLRIIKTSDTRYIQGGGTVVYMLQVFNDGPSDATAVTVSDNLPAGLSFVSSSGCNNDPAGVPDCDLGDIPVGGSKSYTIEATVDPAYSGTLVNTANVSSNTPDPNPNNNAGASQISASLVPAPIPALSRMGLLILGLILLMLRMMSLKKVAPKKKYR